LGSVLSVVVAIWGLGSVALPFGLVGGAAAALFGLTFGVLAIRTKAWELAQRPCVVGTRTLVWASVRE
jgi:membrane associated rhomboid family serine protease